jgi:hypothetical protein
MPPLGQIYSNSDFSCCATSGEQRARFRHVRQSDVKPERTIQYQFGYKQELRDWLGLDLTMFYKDIRDLLGSEIITTYNDAHYKKLSNGDFGNVIGVTAGARSSASAACTAARSTTRGRSAKGNASDPYETAARVDAHEDPRPRNIVLNWDQQHTLNLTVTMAQPGNFNVSTIMRAASGQPYTPVSERTSSRRTRAEAQRVPDRPARREIAVRAGVTAYLTVSNVFDARFWNGTVFASSGSPYYSRTNNSSDQNELSIPPATTARAAHSRRALGPRCRAMRRLMRVAAVVLAVGLAGIARAEVPVPVPASQRATLDAERSGFHDAANIRTIFWNFGMVGDFPANPGSVDLSVFHSGEVAEGERDELLGRDHAVRAHPHPHRRRAGSDAHGDRLPRAPADQPSAQPRHALRAETRLLRAEPEPQPREVAGDQQRSPHLAVELARPAGRSRRSRLGPAAGTATSASEPPRPGELLRHGRRLLRRVAVLPDSRDSTRHGLGLRVEVRGFQWAESRRPET